VARDKKVIRDLLESYDIPYFNRGSGRDSKWGKLFYMLYADGRLLMRSMKFGADAHVSFSSPYAAQSAWFLSKPHICLNDTEHTDRIHGKFTYPFSKYILTPFCYQNDLGPKQIRFKSFMEYFYLNSKYYSRDIRIKSDLGLDEKDKYVIFRFVSWKAHHDFGESGLNGGTIESLIDLFEDSGEYRIFISTEDDIPQKFYKYRIKLASDRMHDILKEADLFIGESATMASESCLLGTYAIYVNSLPLMGYLKKEQEFGLLKHFDSNKGVVDYVKTLISNNELKKLTEKRSQDLKNEFEDPVQFLTDFLEQIRNK
jgi:predicted glycosyltransferase